MWSWLYKTVVQRNSLPRVAVSACLLGQAVRYDGCDKYTVVIAHELKKYCTLLAVCPEVEIGLGVPRAKIRLTQVGKSIKVLQIDDSTLDFSDQLHNFADKYVKQQSLDGLVLQDRSPSCGIGNTALFSQAGVQIGNSSGLFAAKIIELLPRLVVVQANQLQSKSDIIQFVEKLKSAS